jgi:zinc protease
MYPGGQPYSWPLIGYLDDLDRVDVNDLKKFFLRWYTPNNTTLTIAGDVKTIEVMKMVEKYFSPIPKGPDANPQVIAAVSLPQDRYISYEDNNISAPELDIYFPTVPFHHADEPALDALAFIIGGNKSSIFEKKLVSSGLSPFIEVAHPTYELSGQWTILLRGFQDTKLSALDSLCHQYLDEFEKTGFTDEDLQIFKANFEADQFKSLESVQGKGIRLSENQVFTGNPNYLVKDLERYRNVTKEDVMRVYEKYIKGKHAVHLSIYPKGKSNLISKPNNFIPPIYTINAPERAEYKNLVYKKPPLTFDRSKRPSVPATPTVKIPDYWTQRLDNGLKIIGTTSNEVPTIAIQLNIEAGHRYEPKEQSGVAQLLIGLLNESTEKYSSEEISNKLNLLGSVVKIESDGQDIIVTISALTKNIDATLAIVEEMLLHPKFDAQEFDQVKKQQLEVIDNQLLQPRSLADNVFSKLLYGKDHVMSIPAVGTKESISALTLQDVKNYYEKNFSPQVASIVIVGDITKEIAISKLTAFKNWKGNAVVHPKEPSLPVIDKTRIYFVNKSQAPQSEIRVGYLALPYDATGDFYKAKAMNYAFGATLTSRLSMNLREQHGYTYQAYAGFVGNKFIGPFTAFSGVRTNVTDDAVVQFMKEIKNYADNGIKDEEFKGMKTAIAQREALLYETPFQKTVFLKRILDYGLDKNYTTKQSELLKSLTIADINATAKKYLPYNAMDIVVVGDKVQVFEKLKTLGYEVVELDDIR